MPVLNFRTDDRSEAALAELTAWDIMRTLLHYRTVWAEEQLLDLVKFRAQVLCN